MTSDKSVLTESRLNDLITTGGLALSGTWTDFGSLANSWTKLTVPSAACHYMPGPGGLVIVQMHGIGVGTTTNGTTVCSGANGLPSGLRPAVNLWIPVRTDDEGGQQASYMFGTDGHIECWGIGPSATRVDCHTVFPTT